MLISRQKKLKELQSRVNELSFNEQIELVSCKYYEKQKITYEEFVLLALCDEVEFFYNDKLYQIDYGMPGVVSIFSTEKQAKQLQKTQNVNFMSIFELLDKFEIEGKKIRDIWDFVTI